MPNGHDHRMETRARIQHVNDEIYAAWNAHDPDGVVAWYAEQVEVVDITSGISAVGRDEIYATAIDRLAAFPDFSLERLLLVIDGSASADRWVMRGTQTGEYQELAPSGRFVEFVGATFSEYDEHGLVVRDTHYVDVPGMLRQLGLD